MSDGSTSKGKGIVKPYLGFIDTSVLFKKPISCLIAVLSLLLPVYFLNLVISSGLFEFGDGKLIAVGILITLILLFAGVFGALIWWHRRIIKNIGNKWYDNFRCFIQTYGEWFGTVFAIAVFFSVIVALVILGEEVGYLNNILPPFVPRLDFLLALKGPIAGFLVILGTRIFLFLLDPIIWLIKQIWTLFIRIVLYYYRCVIKLHGVIEQNTTVWIGFVWLLSLAFSLAAVAAGLMLLFKDNIWGGAIGIALGIFLMCFFVVKRKQYD